MKRSSLTLAERLKHPHYYRQSIEKLHRKFSAWPTPQLYEIQPEGYQFPQAFFARRRLSKLLARVVSRGGFALAPGELTHIRVKDKLRRVYRFPLTERIIYGALHDMLNEGAHALPDELYSYRSGLGRQHASRAFCRYIRTHRRQHANVKERGLYVWRADIAAYGESIPVGPSSPVWEQIRAEHVLGKKEEDLLAALVRPDLLSGDGGLYQPLFGIPDGTPVSAWLLNLYAIPADRLFAGIEGGFYARYGDDMLFAHADKTVFEEAVAAVLPVLSALGLTLNAAKSRSRFFNGAGRPHAGYQGCSHIEFLGFKISFAGGTAPKTRKTRALLRDLAIRARATAGAVRSLPEGERLKLVCHVLNEALSRNGPHAHPYAHWLHTLADDRHYLRELDYRVARIAAGAVCGTGNVRALRRISWKRLRKEGQLISLLQCRNG